MDSKSNPVSDSRPNGIFYSSSNSITVYNSCSNIVSNNDSVFRIQSLLLFQILVRKEFVDLEFSISGSEYITVSDLGLNNDPDKD